MFDYQGKTALITGASGGIGAAFAQALAARGMAVILTARSTDRLQPIADDLAQRHQVRTEVIAADMSDPAAVPQVVAEVQQRGLAVDLLINNAGFGLHGPFATLDAEQEQQELQVNIAALVALTHAFLPDMLARGSGGIINLASTLAFQPVPFMATYGATKAFVLSFTQALAEEHRGRGTRFVALCPGPTATRFFDTSGGEAVFARMSMRAATQVATTGLHALERGRTIVVDGPANRRLVRFMRSLPTTTSARLLGSVMRPKAG